MLTVMCSQESLSIAMLVDRGYLDYDKPVVHYWPEFGAEGKDRITVKEVMRHEAGLAVFPERFDNFSQLVDLDVVAKHVARQKPEWPKVCGMVMSGDGDGSDGVVMHS